jgi:hypothetical protein
MILTIAFGTVLTLLDPISGHSWADNVGGGSYRGSNAANDLGKQKYFCPLASIDQCQPAAKHNVVLDASALRPCPTNPPTTSPMGNAIAGQQMYIHWAGNGHTPPSQSAGTCVQIGIAPYAVDPDKSAFRIIAPCLPYSHGPTNDNTDGYVTIPADLPAGVYTVWWLWNFAPFWYTSCSDINVAVGTGITPAPTARPTAGPPATNSPVHDHSTVVTAPPRPSSSPPEPTAAAPGTAAPRPPSGRPQTEDCKLYERPNSQCEALFGKGSFCMSWESDKCGRSLCYGQAAGGAC